MSTKAGNPHDTPAMRQYRHFKEKYPDCVLFFRMGDFYEMFYEDAKLAHKVLGVTLTQRTQGVPMAGVPYHSVEGYLRRMILAGYRVAVCEQVQDPAQAKGVVERDVGRVVTPGTLTDENLLDEASENPLAAVVLPEGGQPEAMALVAWAELSTGAFEVAAFPADQFADELARIHPRELLCSQDRQGDVPEAVTALARRLGCAVTARPAWQFRGQEGFEALCRQYQVHHLRAFDLEREDPLLQPAGAVLHYLLETQCLGGDGRLAHLQPPRRFDRRQWLVLDQTTLNSLEVLATIRGGQVQGSLLGTLQRAVTAMGKRLLRQWLCYPLADREAIEARQGVVQTFVSDDRMLMAVRETLDTVQDVPRMLARLAVERASPRDLTALGLSLRQIDPLLEQIQGAPRLAAMTQTLREMQPDLLGLADRIASACVEDPPAHLREGGLIRDGHDAQLDEYRLLQRDSHSWLSRYQKELIDATSIASLKVGYNRVFGYYIELSATQRDKAPADWVRKQTLKNAERFITEPLKAFEEKVLSAQSRAVAREQAIFADLCAQARQAMRTMQQFADTVARLDVLGAFAFQAMQQHYTCPQMVDEPVLHLTAARHPVLDGMLKDRFVPNDLHLGRMPDNADAASLALITGPNMAGKSTFIRQAALLTLMAHAGSFVPASEAVIGLCDRIFTRVGASDELHTGQSTFMVEMTETANICHHASKHSLVILDEIGRGTSTLDGLSLAWAIAEFLADKRPRCLFATHYHELTALAEQYEQVINLNVAVREWKDEIVFLHQIVRGATDRSYGIHVAKIAGLPTEIVGRANELLEQLSVSHNTPAIPASAPDPSPSGQLGLFTQYIEHPVVDELRSVDLNTLTPMQSFDLLRRIKEQLHKGC